MADNAKRDRVEADAKEDPNKRQRPEAAGASSGSRPSKDWFGAAGDGGNATSSVVQPAQKKMEVMAAVSSIKSKLSKPKDDFKVRPPSESARKVGLSRDELLANQARHREKMEANGKAVPYYRKR